MDPAGNRVLSKRVVCATAATFALFFATPVLAATSTTGSLSGSVRGPDGGGLAGVALTVTGPSLPGSRGARTNERGEYRFPLLPPGDGYRIEATLAGFGPIVGDRIAVALGKEVRVEMTMHPTASEEILVTATPALLDVRDTSFSTNITVEQFERFPTTRDFQYLTVLAPGVVFEHGSNPRTPTGAMVDQPSPSVGGATHLESDYVIEGLSTRDPLTGQSATKVTMDFVAEVQVMTGEFSAEYGRALGGVINLVTKSGGNELRGNALAYYQEADWTSETVRTSNKGRETYDLGHDKQDVGVSLGGPLRRDRAWYFLSYDLRDDVAPLHIEYEAHGIDRHEQIEVEEHVYAGKVTFAAAPSHLLTLTGFGNPTNNSGWLYGGFIVEPAVAFVDRHSGSTNYAARYQAVLGPRWFAETSAGFHRQEVVSVPSTPEGRDAPMQGDFSGPAAIYRGGHPYAGEERAARDSYLIRSSHQLAEHEVRYGGDYERNQYDQDTTFAGYWFFGPMEVDSIGARDVMLELLDDFTGYGTNDGLALFVQDRWRPAANLSVDVGLRWERQELSSGRGVVVAEGRAADGTIVRRAADSFVFDDNWAPRLGIAWNPGGRGRSRIYGTAGRFFEAIPVYLNVWSINGHRATESWYYSPATQTSENWYNPTGSPLDGGDWIPFVETLYDFTNGVVPGPTPIDPGTRLQHQDEYSLGAERSFGLAWVAGARLVRRELGDVIEDHSVFDESGKAVDYVIGNIGSGPYASEFRTPKRVYEALELTLRRNLTDRWQLVSSFVSSRARGDIDGLFSYANPNFTAPNTTFEIETPRFQENSYGRLRGDRPYQLKMHSSYTFPFGLTLAEGFLYSAGVPYSALASRNASHGARMLYLQPRGEAGRTPDYYSLDLHAAWEVPLGSRRDVSVTFIADAFNVTDEHEALDVDQEYFYPWMQGGRDWLAPSNRDETGYPRFDPDLPKSEYFGTPIRYQAPRTFQAGVKLSF